ncbi:G10 protein [Babesia duncani]|uniref:G10 protein n=1 Tax=Babesia duncani TaxID=323732 RepID=A0AAD9UPF0_9APIC|nr:G10 protein [Babesia duncani]
MPKIKTLSTKPPPPGWELISEDLESFDERMKAAERESGDGKRRSEVVWPIFRIHHQRSRFIYEMFYVKKKISSGFDLNLINDLKENYMTTVLIKVMLMLI